jgi:hypothetical protein
MVCVVGAYIPPHDTSTLEYVSKALEARLETGVDPILVGDRNADLANPASVREGEIADTPLAAHGLEDMFGHFRPCHPYPDGHTWSMVHQGHLIMSWCDYLLRVDRRMGWLAKAELGKGQ